MPRALGALLAFAILVATAQAATAPSPDPAIVQAAGAKRVYNEVRMPSGAPRGVVIVLHAGGWCGDSGTKGRPCGPAEDRVRDDESGGQYSPGFPGRLVADIERQAVANDYIVIGTTYTSDEGGLADVLATYDQAEARWPGLPIFAWGSSAGAHWALLLGALRPLSGVIGEGTPADFTAWRKATLVGRYFLFSMRQLFGGPRDPHPNLDDYDPAKYYPTKFDTPVLLISGADINGVETDKVIGESTARAFARDNPGRTQIKLLRPGTAYWAHARVNAGDLRDARIAAIAFLAKNRGAPPPAPVPPTGLIQTCNDQPAGSGLAGTGDFTEGRGRDGGQIVLDVSENACGQTKSRGTVTPGGVHTSATDGLQLHVAPGPDGSSVPDGTAATATLDGHGSEITSYSAVYRGFRADPSWELRLTATATDGTRTVLAACDADTFCNSIVAPGTPDGVDAPAARELFTLPDHTASLTWSLTCRAATCPTAATHDADRRGQPAAIDVYGSTATIGIPAATQTPAPVPTPVTTPDDGSGAAVNPEFGSIFRFGTRSDIELACGNSLVVDHTTRDGHDLLVHGYADEQLIGHRVAVSRGGRRVATATVTQHRNWSARVPLRGGQPAAYVARTGRAHVAFRGPPELALQTHETRHTVTVSGRGPKHAHGLVVVERLVGCDDWDAVGEAEARNGRFTTRMDRPSAQAVLLRATLRYHGHTLRSY